jgi:hypothetical protein
MVQHRKYDQVNVFRVLLAVTVCDITGEGDARVVDNDENASKAIFCKQSKKGKSWFKQLTKKRVQVASSVNLGKINKVRMSSGDA